MLDDAGIILVMVFLVFGFNTHSELATKEEDCKIFFKKKRAPLYLDYLSLPISIVAPAGRKFKKRLICYVT